LNIFSGMNSRLAHTLLKDVGFSLLAEGRTIRIRADGYSMYPGIKPGSVIYIEPVADNTIPATGEITAVKKDSGFIVHRLVRIIEKDGRSYVVTRGDSSLEEDDPEPLSHLAGKVVKVELPSGKVVSEKSLINKHPNYTLNRLFLRIILQISRLKKIMLTF
jgi:signal peptidase I